MKVFENKTTMNDRVIFKIIPVTFIALVYVVVFSYKVMQFNIISPKEFFWFLSVGYSNGNLSVGQIFSSTVLLEMVTVHSSKLRFLPYYGIHHLVSCSLVLTIINGKSSWV